MANNCGNCKFRELESYEEPCSSCRNTSGGTPTKWVSQHEPQTNADRIRAMSDEELAKVIICPKQVCDKLHILVGRTDCEACSLEWLKQPAEE